MPFSEVDPSHNNEMPSRYLNLMLKSELLTNFLQSAVQIPRIMAHETRVQLNGTTGKYPARPTRKFNTIK